MLTSTLIYRAEQCPSTGGIYVINTKTQHRVNFTGVGHYARQRAEMIADRLNQNEQIRQRHRTVGYGQTETTSS